MRNKYKHIEFETTAFIGIWNLMANGINMSSALMRNRAGFR